MDANKPILIIEIRTEQNPNLDSSELSTIIAHRNRGELYLESSDIEQIKSVIADAITHLGSNYRHPLYFDVQVIPGDDIDSINPEFDQSSPKRQRRRRKTKN